MKDHTMNNDMRETVASKVPVFKTLGIVPKWDFDKSASLTGTYARPEHIVPPKGGDEFDLFIIRDSFGKEWSVGGGHIYWLMNEYKVQPGTLLRLTFIQWDKMEDGNEARKFSLEVAS